MAIESVGVIGGGAWGTALAQTLRLAGRHVVLWAREPETVEDINVRHVNRTFLPGISLDPDLTATSALADVAKSDAVLMVAPAQHVRTIAGQLRSFMLPSQPIIL
jgi:glycerol-3-phosphate dehydrogenase (NAD(P)+)